MPKPSLDEIFNKKATAPAATGTRPSLDEIFSGAAPAAAQQRPSLDQIFGASPSAPPEADIVAPPAPPKKPGILSSVLKGVASPFVKAGVTGLAALDAGVQAVMGDTAGADKTITEGYNVPGFGQVKPLGIASTPTIVKDAQGNEKLEGGKFGRETLKTLGTGAEIAPWFFGAGQVANLAKGGIKAPLKQIIKSTALEGSASGFVGGAGSELQQDDATFGSVMGSGLLGAGVGLATGVAVPIIGKGLSSVVRKTTGAGADDAARATAQKVATQRADELLAMEARVPALRKYSLRATDQKFDVRKALSETDLLVGAVDENGTINTLQEGGAVSRLNDFLKPHEGAVSEALKAEGRTIPLSQVKKALLEAVDSSGVKGAAKERAIQSIDTEIAGLARDADEAGNLAIFELNNAKIDKYRNINYLDPASSRVDKQIARRFKELVEENTDSIDVKGYNEELSKFYTMLGYLERMNGKKVEGGRLQKYFARAVGSAIGAKLGPLGMIAGSELGGLLQGNAFKKTFGESIGNVLEATPKMTNSLKPKPPKAFQTTNLLPEGRTGDVVYGNSTEAAARLRQIQSEKEIIEATIAEARKYGITLTPFEMIQGPEYVRDVLSKNLATPPKPATVLPKNPAKQPKKPVVLPKKK